MSSDRASAAAMGAVAAVMVAASACGGDTSTQFPGSGGSGGSSVDATTTTGTGGMMSTTVTGGAGGSGGTGAAGAGGGTVQWSEPPVHLEEQCLGPVAIGEFRTFSIPDNTIGLTVVGKAATENTIIGIERLRPGGMGSVIANFDIPGKDLDSFVDIGTVAGADPQSSSADAWPVFVGDWRVRFGDDGAGTPVDLCVYARRTADGLPHGGVMDVNVRIAPGAGVDNGYVQSVLTTMFTSYYEPAIAVVLGNITFGSLAGSFDTIGSSGELHDLFRSSVGFGARPAVNLFVVGDFAGSEFGGAIGVAGGIPGTPVVHGTAQSGVAYQPSGDASYDAAVLAHEIGHLGGLFHTTEVAVDETDPLDDTPECADIGGNPNNCPDVGNMMFPIAYSGTQITATQARVLAGSALYRGATTSGGAPGASLPAAAAASWQGSTAALAQSLRATVRRAPMDGVERLLSSVWCAHGGTDHLAFVHEHADTARLMAIAGDAQAFDLARGRALATLSRFVVTAADRAELWVIADAVLRDPTSGRAALVAAIDLLAFEDDPVLSAMATALRARGDAIVSRRLTELGL